MSEANWYQAVLEADRASRTVANPLDSSLWGVLDGRVVRLRDVGVYEEVPAAEILAAVLRRESRPPEKSLTDRAFELLFLWLGTNVRPQTVQSDTEELARESVRWCRALDSEVANATARREEKPRSARRSREDDDEEAYR